MFLISTRPKRCVKKLLREDRGYWNMCLVRIEHKRCVAKLLKSGNSIEICSYAVHHPIDVQRRNAYETVAIAVCS